MQTMPEDKRKTERRVSKFRSVFPIVLFEDPADLTAVNGKQAEVVDISEEGMGLLTDSPLKVGHEIVFKRQRNWRLPKRAVVIWAAKHKDGYRAGIKFASDN